MARILEFVVYDVGHPLEEWLDDEILNEIPRAINHQSWDYDAGETIDYRPVGQGDAAVTRVKKQWSVRDADRSNLEWTHVCWLTVGSANRASKEEFSSTGHGDSVHPWTWKNLSRPQRYLGGSFHPVMTACCTSSGNSLRS